MTIPAAPHLVGPAVTASVAICPYLLAADGTWRSSTATRVHRCTAVTPPAILAIDKQRRLCLVTEHLGCSTYVAAAGMAGRSGSQREAPRATSRPIVRTIPMVLDRRRLEIVTPGVLAGPASGQGGLVALLAVAFGALIVARLSAGGPDLTPSPVEVVGSPSPSANVTAIPTLAPTLAAPSASSPVEPAPTLVPSEVEPSAAPSEPPPDPSARSSRYTVKQGDTLSAIAGRLGTTWQVLAELNGIDDPGRLRVGQTLNVP